MRILQICPHYLPAYHFGGVQHVAHSLGKALTNSGHYVKVCTTNQKDRKLDLEVPLDSPVNLDGIEVFYEKTILSRYWGFSLSLAKRIFSEVKWADIVFLHFHYQYASFIGGLICRYKKTPYIVFSHGSLNGYGISRQSTILKRIYLWLLESGNFERADFVAYHSQEEMDYSFKFGNGQVIPNGVSHESFSRTPPKGFFRKYYKIPESELVFLYLGRIDAGKGLDILLPAFKQLTAVSPNAHLVIAGGDERGYIDSVTQLISSLELKGSVTLTGLISGELKLAALQDTDVFVLPSRSEGMSIAMLEAMYMSLPVIVSNRVGLWKTIKAKRLGWVTNLDVTSLFEAMQQAAESPERKTIGHRCNELVSTRYTWDSITHDLSSQLTEIIK